MAARWGWWGTLLISVIMLALGGCTSAPPPEAASAVRQETAPAPPAQSTPTALATTPPEWLTGDEWTFGWTSGANAGVKVVAIVGSMEIGGTRYYLARVGDMDHLYTRDLRWAGALRSSRVQIRMTPAEPWFMWPLETGRRWSHRSTYEDANGIKQRDDSFAVIGEESVEVPAGRFRAFKIVRQGADGDADEYWYAPQVGYYVKWIGRRADTQFEEQLQSYRSVPRLMPPSGGQTLPSGQK
jgi:hypothetical protein